MKVRALREIIFKTSKGKVLVRPGQLFKPADPEKLIKAGFVEMVTLPPDQSGKPFAARIFSKILDEEVWIATHPEALFLVPEGAIVYLPEEIRNLKGATPEEIRTIHKIKVELGGKLIAVKQKGEG